MGDKRWTLAYTTVFDIINSVGDLLLSTFIFYFSFWLVLKLIKHQNFYIIYFSIDYIICKSNWKIQLKEKQFYKFMNWESREKFLAPNSDCWFLLLCFIDIWWYLKIGNFKNSLKDYMYNTAGQFFHSGHQNTLSYVESTLLMRGKNGKGYLSVDVLLNKSLFSSTP